MSWRQKFKIEDLKLNKSEAKKGCRNALIVLAIVAALTIIFLVLLFILFALSEWLEEPYVQVITELAL